MIPHPKSQDGPVTIHDLEKTKRKINDCYYLKSLHSGMICYAINTFNNNKNSCRLSYFLISQNTEFFLT